MSGPPRPPCLICRRTLPKGKRRYCSDLCYRQARIATAGGWKNTPGNGAMGGRTGPGYRALLEGVRTRAREGEPCYKCHQAINLDLPRNHTRAFTMHHLDDLMHGHPAVCPPDRVAPAHRGCNASLGLRAQNARRRARAGAASNTTPTAKPNTTTTPEPTSRPW